MQSLLTIRHLPERSCSIYWIKIQPKLPGALPAKVTLTLGASHIITPSIFLPASLNNIHSPSVFKLRMIQLGSPDSVWSWRRSCTHQTFLGKHHMPLCLPQSLWMYHCFEVFAAPPHCTGLSCTTSSYCCGKGLAVPDWTPTYPKLDARQGATINIRSVKSSNVHSQSMT